MYSDLKRMIEELEEIASMENPTDEARERYEESYSRIKEEIDGSFYHLGENASEKAYEEVSKLNKRFNAIHPEFETWDEIREGTLDMMFPDQEDSIYEIE